MAAFRPIRYRMFVAGEESQCGADATNTRPIQQKVPQVQAQLFLSRPTGRSDHMLKRLGSTAGHQQTSQEEFSHFCRRSAILPSCGILTQAARYAAGNKLQMPSV